MSLIGAMTLKDAAGRLAGNWEAVLMLLLGSAASDRGPGPVGHHLHPQSRQWPPGPVNAGVIATVLKPFCETENPDVVFESHSHWAVGHVDGFSIRVYRDGAIT